MNNFFPPVLRGLVAALLLSMPTASAAETPATPLTRAHSHNDYEHTRPLLDALAQGFGSVEADIYLVDGQLLVAHDRRRTRPDRTLEGLYLDPLLARVKANGGRVFKDGPPFYLLIDCKSAGAEIWPVLRPTLERYRAMLTVFKNDATETNAVTVVLSGNSPRATLASEPVRLAAIDGRLPDLATNPSRHLVPWISEDWTSHFKWRGWQAMPAAEKQKLGDLVGRAHAQGRMVRFWGGPDSEPLWRAQFEAGVDLINTDKLAALAAFLAEQKPSTPGH
jgi:glycerophosphoryl diester phosphodiesterase